MAGIVYSHRNEDIVNLRAGTRVIESDRETSSNSLKDPPIAVKQLSDSLERKSSSRENKKRQFSLVARFMNMTELEFSNWILSAAPNDVEKALRDYKKRRKEKITSI
jgi:DNA excision repair protein ERCC-6-like 2